MQHGRLRTARRPNPHSPIRRLRPPMFPDRLFIALFNPDIDCRAISIRFDSAPISPSE